MASFKIERFSENIRREVSYLIRHLKNFKDRSCNLSVARVEISAGGRLAKIYISSIKGLVDAKFAIKSLKNASGFMKRELSNKLKLRKCPEIEFAVDDFVCVHERLNSVLQKIEKNDASLK